MITTSAVSLQQPVGPTQRARRRLTAEPGILDAHGIAERVGDVPDLSRPGLDRVRQAESGGQAGANEQHSVGATIDFGPMSTELPGGKGVSAAGYR